MPALKSSWLGRVNNSLEPISSRNNPVYQSPINRTPLCEHFQNINQRIIINNNGNQVINSNQAIVKLKIMATSSGFIPMSSDALRCFVEKELLSRQESDLNRPLILDCRPFLIHSESHIMGSISVHCPAILR